MARNPTLRRWNALGLTGALVLGGGLFFLAETAWTQTGRPPDYDFYDARTLQQGAAKGPPARRAQPGAAGDRAGRLYRLDGPLTPAASGDPETVARRFLSQPGGGVRNASSPFELPLIGRYQSLGGEFTHLVFQPRASGAGFFDSEVSVHIDGEGRIWRVQGLRPLPPAGPLAPALGPRQAAERALEELAPGVNSDLQVRKSESGSGRRTVLEGAGLLGPALARLVWFPLGSEAVPAWRIYLAVDSRRAYSAVVDAAEGEILFSQNLAFEAAPEGTVFRAPDRPHPEAGLRTAEPFTGWRAEDGACPAEVYPSEFRSGAEEGRCWVADAETLGNNADVCADLDGDNVCDGRAMDADAHFHFAFANSYEETGDPAPDRAAALANVFYWVNSLHDWLYRLGFDEAAGNFQSDNFGRGGEAGDVLQADVHDGAVGNNATFLTPPDGIAPRMQLGLFSVTRRDSAFDGDIIIHEYVHGLTNRLVGGPQSVTGLFRWHSGALAEGWSDGYAAALTADPVIGEYVVNIPGTGIRSVAFDDSPYTFGQFGTLLPKAIPGTDRVLRLPQLHRDGEIWATVLWELREFLGPEDFEQAATAAVALTPSRPSMLDARDAFLQAAQAAGVDGENACGVWTVFAARGFGASAALNPFGEVQANDTALSVYESFDLPGVCGGSAPALGTVLFEDGAEDDAAGWQAGGLWHRTTRRAAAGSWSWWFGQESTGDYDTGARTFGDLTSPPISLAGVKGAVLEWDQFFAGEGFNSPVELGDGAAAPYLNADSGRVLISTDSGASWRTVTHLAHNTSSGGFVHYRVNLSRWAGQAVLLRFDFDTFDELWNSHEGWFLDNVRVTALGEAGPALDVSPGSLEFAVAAGAADPALQELSIANSGGGTLAWTAEVSAGGSWLKVSPLSGEAPASVSVSVETAFLAPGTYEGEVEVSAPDASGSPALIPVTLTVAAPAGPAAAWAFEEAEPGAGVTLADASGNGHGATTRGYGSASVLGVAGGARLFNGATDYAEAAPSLDLTPLRFTVRAWVRVLSYPEPFGVIVSAFGGSNSQGWYLAVNSDGRVIFMAATPGHSPWLVSNASLEIGRWHQVTVTFDRESNLGFIYVDGAFDTAAEFPGLTPDASLPAAIGRASWYDGYYLNALLDELEIYPAWRTSDQVLAGYESFAPPPAEANTVTPAEWRMEDETDASGNGRSLTLHGTTAASGVSGLARRFNGASDRASVASEHTLTPTKFTLRAWVRVLSAPSPFGVMFANFAGGRGWYVAVKDDGRLIFSTRREGGSTRWMLSQEALPIGEWRRIAVTYDGTRQLASIYINGALDTQEFIPGISPQLGGHATLGRASWYDTYYLHCDLDEVRLDARHRTAAEVAEDSGSFPAAGAVAVWEFDEEASGAGATLADASGNGHHAVTQTAGTSPAAGLFGGARALDGSSGYAALTPHAQLSTESFSLSAWLKIESYADPFGVAFANFAQAQGWYLAVNNDGRVILSVAASSEQKGWLLSNSALALGGWHHVAVTFDGPSRRGRIYIDGQLDRDAIFPGLTPQTEIEPTFGRASWVDTYYLNAALDRTKLFSRELSRAEVAGEFGAE